MYPIGKAIACAGLISTLDLFLTGTASPTSAISSAINNAAHASELALTKRDNTKRYPSKTLKFGGSGGVGSDKDTTIKRYTANGQYTIDIKHNVGKAHINERDFNIGILTAGGYPGDDGQDSWIYRFAGASADELIFGFITTKDGFKRDDTYAFLTSPSETHMFFAPPPDKVNGEDAQQSDSAASSKLNIQGSYTVTAWDQDCPTFNSPGSDLGSNCVGKLGGFDAVVFGIGSGVVYDGSWAHEFFAAVSDGTTGCILDIVIDVDQSKVFSVLSVCFGQDKADSLGDAVFNAKISAIPAWMKDHSK